MSAGAALPSGETGRSGQTGRSGTGRRVLAILLPDWPIERLLRHWRREAPHRARAAAAMPFATIAAERGRLVLEAVGRHARLLGLAPGMALADARAVEPGLVTVPARPAEDLAALDGLARWAERYTPFVALAGLPPHEAGLYLEIAGSAHLFGGEAALLADAGRRLAGFGLTARLAIADSAEAAWAVAVSGPPSRTGSRARPPAEAAAGAIPRSPDDPRIVPQGGAAAALARLPVGALRLDAATLEGLRAMGLRRIGDLARVPRASLAGRFPGLLDRLDRAHGRLSSPLSPRRPATAYVARRAFAEPIGRTEDVLATLDRLLALVAGQLERDGKGGRRFRLDCHRVDGSVTGAVVGTHLPSRDTAALRRLFDDRLDGLDAGFGIELMVLTVERAEPLVPRQAGLDAAGAASAGNIPGDLAGLVDRLSNRLGPRAVMRALPRQSHWPDRAVRLAPPLGLARSIGNTALALAPRMAVAASPEDGTAWPGPETGAAARPLLLVSPPEPIEATAPVPDDPPVLIRWRGRAHRVALADGAERIAPEWWRRSSPAGLAGGEAETRDYYRIELEDGRRLWVYRAGRYGEAAGPEAGSPGEPLWPRWYLAGFFA
ncbi:MAG: DNA polymerase Y family protein [Azospirillaceae bacterium]